MGNKIAFWIPGCNPGNTQQIFGCSSHGLSTCEKSVLPNEEGIAYWKHEIPGDVLNGSSQDVLKRIDKLASPGVCIVLANKASGFEDFLSQASKALPKTSFIGGIAAHNMEHPQGEISPANEDVCVMAVSGDKLQLEVLNIYDDTQIQVEFEATSKRQINLIKELPNGNWQDAVSYYRSKQIEFGIDPNNFESLCFCDKNKRNLHCSISNEKLQVGANLPDENILNLNFISPEKATQKLENFINDTNSLIFGCAGILSLVNKPVLAGDKSLAGFMFGEVVTIGETVELGNLMLTKLKIL